MIKLTSYFTYSVALTLIFVGCSVIKPNQLFEDSNAVNPNDTVFYAASEIYHDFLTSEAWSTQAADHCVQVEAVKEAAFQGDYGMHITWNRQGVGCPWLGIGFGWDNWMSKDISSIKNTAAIEFWVRMVEGERGNLPWAVGLEDYNGLQAWLGMSQNVIKADKITTDWTRIEMPLSEFNWEEQGADPTLLKHIIFNLEASGEIYMDEARIVPYSGGFRKRAHVPVLSKADFTPDGLTNDLIWETERLQFEGNTVHLALIDSFLCIAMKTVDDTPLQNKNTGDETYNGDAFEIAFSTDLEAPQKRLRLRTTDQHLGFALGDQVSAWNWQKHQSLNQTVSATKQTAEGYVFEVMINLNELEVDPLVNGELYGLEIAVDHGDLNGRARQDRWNDPANSGFYENPTLWGEMIVVEPVLKNKNL